MQRKQETLCKSCVVADCDRKGDNIWSCQWYMDLQGKERIRQQQDDLVFIIRTKQGARRYIDKINEHVFNPELFTGNSETHYKCGSRAIVMSEMSVMLDVLDLDNYTDLVVYLNNVINPKGV